MATITTRRIIEKMLEGDGTYPGDPQAAEIWEYENIGSGEVMWAVFWHPRNNDLAYSPFVGKHVLLWSRERGHVNMIGVLGAPTPEDSPPF